MEIICCRQKPPKVYSMWWCYRSWSITFFGFLVRIGGGHITESHSSRQGPTSPSPRPGSGQGQRLVKVIAKRVVKVIAECLVKVITECLVKVIAKHLVKNIRPMPCQEQFYFRFALRPNVVYTLVRGTRLRENENPAKMRGGKTMSTANQRKRHRRKTYGTIDYQAEQEALAVSTSFKPRTIDFGKRLRYFYTMDGERFPTGQKHRRQAVAGTVVEHAVKVRHKHHTKAVDLATIAVHKRVAGGAEQYRLLAARRAQRLCAYQVGLVQPIGG